MWQPVFCLSVIARRALPDVAISFTSSPDLLKQGDGDPRGKYIVIELNYWRITFATHYVSCRVMTWGV